MTRVQELNPVSNMAALPPRWWDTRSSRGLAARSQRTSPIDAQGWGIRKSSRVPYRVGYAGRADLRRTASLSRFVTNRRLQYFDLLIRNIDVMDVLFNPVDDLIDHAVGV